jgi:FkbM family methyltransferase
VDPTKSGFTGGQKCVSQPKGQIIISLKNKMVRTTRKATRKIHYDFIEVGTSDFNTLIQKATSKTVGLSVEPLEEYLNRLPVKPRVKKINAALSKHSGSIDLYYVPDAVRKDNNLPGWMKGTNSVGSPHPTVVRYLEKHGLPKTLLHHKKVPVLSVSRLFREYRVGSLDYLKIDTEGHDVVIVNAYLDLAEKDRSLLAHKILFESNTLSDKDAVSHLRDRLASLGYIVETKRQDTVATLE